MLTASFLSFIQLLSSKWISLPASFAFIFCLSSHRLCPPCHPFLSIFITVLLTCSSSILLQLQLSPVFSMLLLAVVTKHSSFLPVYIFFLLSSFILPIPVSLLTWKFLEKQKEQETWKFESHRKRENSSLPQQRLCLCICTWIIWN